MTSDSHFGGENDDGSAFLVRLAIYGVLAATALVGSWYCVGVYLDRPLDVRPITVSMPTKITEPRVAGGNGLLYPVEMWISDDSTASHIFIDSDLAVLTIGHGDAVFGDVKVIDIDYETSAIARGQIELGIDP